MPKINLDLRFTEVFYELGALQQYLDSFENQLPIIAKQEEKKVYTRIRNEKLKHDPAEREEILKELYDLTEEVLPRFFRGSILVTLWAIFESAITDIAKEIRDQQNQPLTINDIRGDFLERAKKYFNHVIDFPLGTNDKQWKRIRMLKVFRNAIAHGNGRIENVKNNLEVRKIKNWERDGIGLSITMGGLLFSEQFVRETLSAVDQTLDDLIKRVFEKYPDPKSC